MKQGETVDKRDGNSGIMTPMLGLKGKNCTFYDGKIWNYNQSINQSIQMDTQTYSNTNNVRSLLHLGSQQTEEQNYLGLRCPEKFQ